jgi:hypothetical protein
MKTSHYPHSVVALEKNRLFRIAAAERRVILRANQLYQEAKNNSTCQIHSDQVKSVVRALLEEFLK